MDLPFALDARADDVAPPSAPAPRQPVLARDVVATSQPLAAQAGMAAFERGGNAIDAALAAAITLAVVEPVSTGLGSDLFAMVWDGAELQGLNASGRAPAGWTRARFAGASAMPLLGWDSVTIPGAVAGWADLSRRHGRLPFAALCADAIRHAREGFLVSPVVAYKWNYGLERWLSQPGFAEAFAPGGRAPRAGERFANPALAESLEQVADSGGESFYRGELAEAMVAHARACGGVQSADDFAAHASEWVRPIGQDYRGHTLFELPPNGQGIAALIALGILGHVDLAGLGADHPDAWHLPIEAMKLAMADVQAHVGDPNAMRVSVEDLLAPDYLARRAASIRRHQAGAAAPGLPAGGTVQVSTADREGRMVSLIQSSSVGFGSGVVVPGTGILLQNRGGGFNLIDGHPNVVGPKKRPFHTIIPAMLAKDGLPVAAFGVVGGPMQPQGHVQLVSRILDHGQNPQAALDAPRWKAGPGMRVDFEPGTPPRLIEALAARDHEPGRADTYVDMGGAQLVWRLGDGWLAASDWRRDGHPLGR